MATKRTKTLSSVLKEVEYTPSLTELLKECEVLVTKYFGTLTVNDLTTLKDFKDLVESLFDKNLSKLIPTKQEVKSNKFTSSYNNSGINNYRSYQPNNTSFTSAVVDQPVVTQGDILGSNLMSVDGVISLYDAEAEARQSQGYNLSEDEGQTIDEVELLNQAFSNIEDEQQE